MYVETASSVFFCAVQIMPVRDVYCQTLQKRSSCHFLARAQKRVDLISRFMMGNSVKHNNNKGSEKKVLIVSSTQFLEGLI